MQSVVMLLVTHPDSESLAAEVDALSDHLSGNSVNNVHLDLVTVAEAP